MAERLLKYASPASITCTLASLASSATVGQESTAVDNSSNKYIDAEVRLHFKLQAGSPANDKAIYVYFYGSSDGSNYGDNATGSNAALTLRSPTNLLGPWVVACPDSGGLTYKTMVPSVAAFFSGRLPPKWGFVVLNYTGVTLSATEGDHVKEYTGISETVA